MAQGWGDLLRGENAGRCAVVGGGITIHAVNVFIVTTILPSVVHEIGGLRYFAWSTTLYVVASLLGGANTARLMRMVGVRNTYRMALGCFALGCLICALAPGMGVLLAGRAVQGFGAGFLSALSFSMVRVLFPKELWSRAFSVVSLAWGIATLGGPAIGGVFAQYDAWRAAFWSLLCLTPVLLVVVEMNLPRGLPRAAAMVPISLSGLAVLAAAALAVSVGGMATAPVQNAAGLVVALGLLLVFRRLEDRGPARVLPLGACDPGTKLGATYLVMVLLLLGVTSEIFVPYFLQVLHGLSPLHAGYLSALMSGGWSVASITSATSLRVRRMLQIGPLVMAAGLLILFALMPQEDGGLGSLVAIGVGLTAIGAGIGLCWPHLGASVFTNAQESERDLAGASITTVIMVGNAFGSALGGMITNMAEVAVAPSQAAAWLFGLVSVAPLGALLAMRRLR